MSLSKSQTVCGLGLVGLALQIAAISTNCWSHSSGMDIGLWKSCAGHSSNCMHLPPDGDKSFPKNSLYVVRIFSLLSAILLACGMLCYCYLCKSQTDGTKKLCSCLYASAVCGIIAVVVWAAEMFKINGMKYTPGYSYFLFLGGTVAAMISAMYGHMG